LQDCAAERERKGDKVYVFDVTDPNGETHCRSGFGESDRNGPDIYDDIQRVMWVLIPETRANNPYWDNAARKVATAVGVMVAETPDENLCVARVLSIIEAHDYEVQIRDFIYRSRIENRPFPQAAVSTVLSWLDNKAEEGAAAVRDNILTALALWHVPRIASATSRDDFKVGDIRSQRISVFVCAQPGDIRRLRPIYSLLFTQLMQKNTRVEWRNLRPRREHRTLIMLDERWALGEMKELDDAFAFVRSYGLRFGLVLQNKKQLYSAIGEHGAKNLFDNTYVELIFGGTDYDTAKEVSERSAVDTVKEESVSKPKFLGFINPSKYNENVRSAARPLLLPQEVTRLPKSKVVVQIKGEPPLILDRIFWYSDPHFRTMSNGTMPPMPKLTVEVARDTDTDIGV
jgi:type IV secretion system protein VirD4